VAIAVHRLGKGQQVRDSPVRSAQACGVREEPVPARCAENCNEGPACPLRA
jgi:hypothetical protein